MDWVVKSFSELSIFELYAILKARVDVFVVEQNCPYPDLDGWDSQTMHIFAKDNYGIIAYCRVFPPEIKYNEASIGRVLTTHGYRKQGLGKKLLAQAIDVIQKRYEGANIRISAQDYLMAFYQSFGFETTGLHYLEDNIPHSEMLRTE